MGNLKALKIGDEEFEVLDPVDILLHIIKHRSFASSWLIKDMLFLGAQGTGKSTFINYLLELITSIKLYQESGILIIRTNDVRILSDKRYEELFEKKKIIILILDDIMSGGVLDSRRSGSGLNVGMTGFYNKSRHALRDKWERDPIRFSRKGILFVLFANQVLSRVDATIRENIMVKIFTSFVDRRWFHNEFRSAKQKKEMNILRKATFEGDLGDKYTAKAINIIKLKTGQLSACEIPRYYDEANKIEYSDDNAMIDIISNRFGVSHYEIFRDLDKEDFFKILMEKLKSKYRFLDDVDKGIMVAYLQQEADKLKEEYAINYTKADIIRVIDTARMSEYDEIRANQIEILNGWTDYELLLLHDTLGLSFREIEAYAGIPHSTAHKKYERAKKRFELRLNTFKNKRNEIIELLEGKSK